jgi:hypothetical protein
MLAISSWFSADRRSSSFSQVSNAKPRAGFAKGALTLSWICGDGLTEPQASAEILPNLGPNGCREYVCHHLTCRILFPLHTFCSTIWVFEYVDRGNYKPPPNTIIRVFALPCSSAQLPSRRFHRCAYIGYVISSNNRTWTMYWITN